MVVINYEIFKLELKNVKSFIEIETRNQNDTHEKIELKRINDEKSIFLEMSPDSL